KKSHLRHSQRAASGRYDDAEPEREAAQQQHPIAVISHPSQNPPIPLAPGKAIFEPRPPAHSRREVIKLRAQRIRRQRDHHHGSKVEISLIGEKGSGDKKGFAFEEHTNEQQQVSVLEKEKFHRCQRSLHRYVNCTMGWETAVGGGWEER